MIFLFFVILVPLEGAMLFPSWVLIPKILHAALLSMIFLAGFDAGLRLQCPAGLAPRSVNVSAELDGVRPVPRHVNGRGLYSQRQGGYFSSKHHWCHSGSKASPSHPKPYSVCDAGFSTSNKLKCYYLKFEAVSKKHDTSRTMLNS